MPDMAVVVAIDAGTSGVRALAVDEHCRVVDTSYRELPQHFPAPGLVEHDAAQIWALVEATLSELYDKLEVRGHATAAIGIANQRETAVAWDRSTGRPCHRAIVWQDRRTASRCRELTEAGHLPLVRELTGLVLDPYFSGTKWSWMLETGGVEVSGSLALGTVDDWICWNLTGGAGQGKHVTDPSNASRTLCYDIGRRSWSAELCEILRVPLGALGEVRPSACRYGTVAAEVAGGRFRGVPVSAIAGDQQAALFGHGCYEPGDTKVTYGTGSFVLMNLGTDRPQPTEGLLTTVAWDLGEVAPRHGRLQLRARGLDLLRGRHDPVAARRPRAHRRCGTSRAARLRDPRQRRPVPRAGLHGIGQSLVGRRGARHCRRHLERNRPGALRGAAVEAIAFQCRDVLDAMVRAADQPLIQLRADGGAAAMDLLLQSQADQCGVPVARPRTTEVTALGAAMLAGLAEGIWSTLDELRALTAAAEVFEPSPRRNRADAEHAAWRAALERSRHWQRSADDPPVR